MRKIVFYSMVFVFVGCTSAPEIPKNVLSKEDMASAMAKMMVAEEITYQKGLQSDSSKQLFLGHYKPILLDSLKISIEKFDSSFKYYSKNPEYFREVIELAEKKIAPKDSLNVTQ